MFRNQFHLTAREEHGLQGMCLFTMQIYAKAWINAPLATGAPQHDFVLRKAFSFYDKIDAVMGKAAFRKFSNHLWFLSVEMVFPFST